MAKPKVMWLSSPLESRYGVMNIMRGWASRMNFEEFDTTFVFYSPNPAEVRSRLAEFPALRLIHLPELWSFSKGYVPALRALTSLMKTEKFDIVHTVFVQADILGAFAARRCGVPIVVSSVMGYLVNPVGRSRWKKPVYRLAYHFAQKKIDRMMTITKTTGAELVNDFGVPREKIQVVYSGVAQKVHPRRSRHADSFVVGFVGMLIPQKGVTTLIAAAPAILRQIPDARFVVAGDGPERKKLEEQARSLGVSDKIEFLGFIEDIPRLMATFDVFAFTSLPAYDGLPRVILEAMVQRTPVVASRTDPIEEVVAHGSTGWLYQAGDAEGLAAMIQNVHDHPELVPPVTDRAFQQVSCISVENEVEQIEDCYRTLLSRSGRN